MRTIHITLLAASLGLLIACESAKPDAPPPEKKPEMVAKTATTAAVAAKADETGLSDEDVPVPGDFDEEVGGSITADNLKSELDALEKEIDTE